jgi:hypothetical protein
MQANNSFFHTCRSYLFLVDPVLREAKRVHGPPPSKHTGNMPDILGECIPMYQRIWLLSDAGDSAILWMMVDLNALWTLTQPNMLWMLGDLSSIQKAVAMIRRPQNGCTLNAACLTPGTTVHNIFMCLTLMLQILECIKIDPCSLLMNANFHPTNTVNRCSRCVFVECKYEEKDGPYRELVLNG